MGEDRPHTRKVILLRVPFTKLPVELRVVGERGRPLVHDSWLNGVIVLGRKLRPAVIEHFLTII
jgi:hypothetical protein